MEEWEDELGRRERRMMGSWEEEKVGKKQDWGMGSTGEGEMGKGELGMRKELKR
jgi:hypothetical protein